MKRGPRREDREDKREGLLTRRGILVGAAALGGGLLGLQYRPQRERLRPPGAAVGPDFSRRCIRCLRCAEVCPPKAIRFDSTPDLAGSDTPYIDARERACTLCMKCTQVCPSGALTAIEADPENVQRVVRMGRPELYKEKCVAWTRTGECRACYYICPYADSAVRLEGPLLGPAFDRDSCVGCGQCEEVCPEAARAVRIIPREGESV